MSSLKPSHIKTRNKRGFMHPLSSVTQAFINFAANANKPVIDMGCAYGNAIVEMIARGVKDIIACDMEEQHLQFIKEEVKNLNYPGSLKTYTGYFPTDFDFNHNSISAIHASHILEYLTGQELEVGLRQIFRWLEQQGRLFIVCYSIHIKELDNPVFKKTYQHRLSQGIKWAGCLEDYDCYTSPLEEEDDAPFPSTLHMCELDALVKELETIGFEIDSAAYLDGQLNGAVEEI